MSEPLVPSPARRRRALGATIAVLALFAVSGVAAAIAWPAPRADSGETVIISELGIGDCVLSVDWNAPAPRADVERVDCSVPHGAELVHRVRMTEIFDAYPGDAIVEQWADTQCGARQTLTIDVDPAVEGVERRVYRAIHPGAETWGYGGDYMCFLTTRDGAPLTRGFSTRSSEDDEDRGPADG